MTIEDKLKNLILEQYSSIREFTIKIDMAYSTLDSIFKRGIQNATLTNVLKICKGLHISADALANGDIEYQVLSMDDEHELIDILINLRCKLLSDKELTFNNKPADQDTIQTILDALEVGLTIAKRHENRKTKP